MTDMLYEAQHDRDLWHRRCRTLEAALGALVKAVNEGPYIDGSPVHDRLEPIEVMDRAVAVLRGDA